MFLYKINIIKQCETLPYIFKDFKNNELICANNTVPFNPQYLGICVEKSILFIIILLN